MNDSTASTRTKPGVFALVALALVAVLIPVAIAEAGVKLKDGIYYQPATAKNQTFGYVETTGGKVVSAGFNIRFKDSDGMTCVPEGYFDSSGYINVVFNTNKVKPDRNDRFTVKSRKSPSYPGLKATVTGRFKSSKKASFKATLKAGGCTAKGNFTKAEYTLGG